MQTFENFMAESSAMIDDSVKYSLMYEVVYQALVTMRENKKVSPSDAIKIAYEEWIGDYEG